MVTTWLGSSADRRGPALVDDQRGSLYFPAVFGFIRHRRRSGARLLVLALLGDYLVLSLGTALVEGWSLFDGFYYGMACLTTVGFGDLVPLTLGGRLFALILIPVGIVLGFGAGFLMIQDAVRVLINRRDLVMIDSNLDGHTIVCGYGKVGRVVARTLINLKRQVCVVERDPALTGRLEDDGIDHVIGDAMDTSVLERAGVDKASCVVTTFENDADNVYVVLEIRDLRSDLTIIASASGREAVRRLRLAGAHRVIAPPAIAGEMLAKSAINPEAIDLMTEVTDASARDATIGQVVVQEQSWIAGRTLADIGKSAPGALVVMVKDGEEVTMAPGGTSSVRPGMVLVVVGQADAVRAMSAVEAPR